MTCHDVERLCDAYADGELDLERALEVEAHLAGCAPCQARLEAGRTLTTVLKTAPYYAAPTEFAARMSGSAPEAAMTPPVTAARPSGAFHPAAPWLAAAAVVLVSLAAVAFVMRWRDANAADATAQAVVTSHIRSLMADHLTDVASSDRHTVKPWFAGRIPFSPTVVDLAADGFPLAGGRVDYLDGHAAAGLVYKRREHVINVFVWPVSDANTAVLALPDSLGYHSRHWTHDGMAFWVASDVSAAELDDFTAKLRAAIDAAR